MRKKEGSNGGEQEEEKEEGNDFQESGSYEQQNGSEYEPRP